MAAPDAPSPPPGPESPPNPVAWNSLFHRLFGHAVMVSDLLRSYLPDALLSELDLDAFDARPARPLSAKQHSDKTHERIGDLHQPLYRKTASEPVEGVLLLLEFQATPDSRMPLRMMVYGGLGLQQLLDLCVDRPRVFDDPALAPLRPTPTSLPPVLPLVLYHGKKEWGRQRSLCDNFRLNATSPLAGLQPDGSYVLIDVWRAVPRTRQRGPCVLLFEMIRAEETDDLRPVAVELDALIAGLEPSNAGSEGIDAGAEQALSLSGALRAAFLLFILGLMRSRGYPQPGCRLSRQCRESCERQLAGGPASPAQRHTWRSRRSRTT